MDEWKLDYYIFHILKKEGQKAEEFHGKLNSQRNVQYLLKYIFSTDKPHSVCSFFAGCTMGNRGLGSMLEDSEDW